MSRSRIILIILGVLAFFLILPVLFLSTIFCHHGKNSGNVAILTIEGDILDPQETLEEVTELRKNDEVKAVIVRIDSPGGSVGASQEIYESLLKLKESKKLVASMGTVAASGGYYVALPAHKIVANRGTITGSIGVRMELVNVENLMHWAQLKSETLKSGKMKDVGSSTRPMTEEERTYLNQLLAELHQQFKQAVVEQRHLSSAQVAELADGRVFTGETAVKNGLIDSLGNLDEAVRVAGELAGIKGEPQVFSVSEQNKKWWQYLIEGAVKNIAGVLIKQSGVPAYQFLTNGSHLI